MLHCIQNKPDYVYRSDPKMIAIAPAEDKKRYTCKSNPYVGPQAASIARRNARERNRVKQVNDGFNALRKRLPSSVIAALSGGARRGSGKKLSKVDTLRMVVEYIRYLESMIDENDSPQTFVSSKDQVEDEGVYGGSSPYSEPISSPAGSECSSGVSSGYSVNNTFVNYQPYEEQTSPIEDCELLDAITWWQTK